MSELELDESVQSKIKEGMDELVKIVAGIDDEKFLAEFFSCLLTPAECFDLGKRWLLVKEISNGTTQREIAKEFKMSLCKITRGSKELKKSDSAFRKVLDNLKSSQNE